MMDEDKIVKSVFGEYFAKMYVHKFSVRRVQIIKFRRYEQYILKIKIKIGDLQISFLFDDNDYSIFKCDNVEIFFSYNLCVTYDDIKKIEKINTEWIREMITYFTEPDNYNTMYKDIISKFCIDSTLLNTLHVINKKRQTFMLCNHLKNIFPHDIAKIIYFKILFFLFLFIFSFYNKKQKNRKIIKLKKEKRKKKMSIAEYKEKIKELNKKIEYLEKERNIEIQIMFWRKFCKIVDIDFNVSDIKFNVSGYYFVYRNCNAYLNIRGCDKYDGFRLTVDRDLHVIKNESDKRINIKYTNSIKDIFKSYSTIEQLDKLFIYIYKYSQILQNTSYLSNLIIARTFYLSCTLPPTIKNIIIKKILFFLFVFSFFNFIFSFRLFFFKFVFLKKLKKEKRKERSD